LYALHALHTLKKLIQSEQIQSDVNPEIHALEKKLKAFEEFGIG
jgi:hypothetical protein